MTRRLDVLQAVYAALQAGVPGARVELESDEPETVPAGGLVVVRDGGLEEEGPLLGGEGPHYYTHTIDVECYAAGEGRLTVLDGLAAQVVAAIATDSTLGGLVHHAEAATEDISRSIEPGLPTERLALMTVTAHYQTSARL